MSSKLTNNFCIIGLKKLKYKLIINYIRHPNWVMWTSWEINAYSPMIGMRKTLNHNWTWSINWNAGNKKMLWKKNEASPEELLSICSCSENVLRNYICPNRINIFYILEFLRDGLKIVLLCDSSFCPRFSLHFFTTIGFLCPLSKLLLSPM